MSRQLCVLWAQLLVPALPASAGKDLHKGRAVLLLCSMDCPPLHQSEHQPSTLAQARESLTAQI